MFRTLLFIGIMILLAWHHDWIAMGFFIIGYFLGVWQGIHMVVSSVARGVFKPETILKEKREADVGSE